jgi:hypothetical protein
LEERRFALFNTSRWDNPEERPSCCHVVPTIWRGNFSNIEVDALIEGLAAFGSHAVPGFMNPEGIVVFHTAGNVGFKKTIEKDEMPKSIATRKAA